MLHRLCLICRACLKTSPFFKIPLAHQRNIFINLMGSMPGYWFTVLFIEYLGRRKIQFLGFAVLTLILTVLACAYKEIIESRFIFVGVYSIAQFFFNFGPNSTTFIVPSEVFPTRYRSTSYGICAASGKIGAIISSYTLGYGLNHAGIQSVIGSLSAVMFLGFVCTYFVPETKGTSLEELNKENSEFQSVPKIKNKKFKIFTNKLNTKPSEKGMKK
eukprot:TRINITY_DN5180_c0_g3_i1.p2 TRINITY_DN5180_c0_g3~~TRINITY_DN5180_c0_g3_i1.p2  ORF type:complete len:216 (+),score=28.33 TRINITY_DN5180_c0_g3_i1:735-1382(+)